MREEFKFRLSGTSVLLSFAELNRALQNQMEFERDKIEGKIQELAEAGIFSATEVDTRMQEQMEHERDRIDRRLVEIFDTRLARRNDTMSIGVMKSHDVMDKFR